MKEGLEEKKTPKKKKKRQKGKRKQRDKLSEERQEKCAQFFTYCPKTKKGKGGQVTECLRVSSHV